MIDLLHETKPQNAWIPLYVRTEVLVHIYQKALERNNFKVLVMKKKTKRRKRIPCYFLLLVFWVQIVGHSRECLPLILILRNRLKYALTYREVIAILMQRHIFVDGMESNIKHSV